MVGTMRRCGLSNTLTTQVVAGSSVIFSGLGAGAARAAPHRKSRRASRLWQKRVLRLRQAKACVALVLSCAPRPRRSLPLKESRPGADERAPTRVSAHHNRHFVNRHFVADLDALSHPLILGAGRLRQDKRNLISPGSLFRYGRPNEVLVWPGTSLSWPFEVAPSV